MRLILSRRKGEAVKLETNDGTILVRVCKCSRGAVSLAIEAPKEVRIIREELGGPREPRVAAA